MDDIQIHRIYQLHIILLYIVRSISTLVENIDTFCWWCLILLWVAMPHLGFGYHYLLTSRTRKFTNQTKGILWIPLTAGTNISCGILEAAPDQ